MFNAACGPESLIRAAGQIDCSRNFLNPPYIFLRDWLGLTDPNSAVYTFAGGSKKLYDFVDDNPSILFKTVDYTKSFR